MNITESLTEWRTAADVAALTGLPVADVRAWLCDACRRGEIEGREFNGKIKYTVKQ